MFPQKRPWDKHANIVGVFGGGGVGDTDRQVRTEEVARAATQQRLPLLVAAACSHGATGDTAF